MTSAGRHAILPHAWMFPHTARATARLHLKTYLSLEPRLAQDLVLPPTLFTTQTSATVVTSSK